VKSIHYNYQNRFPMTSVAARKMGSPTFRGVALTNQPFPKYLKIGGEKTAAVKLFSKGVPP
jgi:hypothetical protein